MRTYYDPEDDSCCQPDSLERLLDRADRLRDERKDREMEEMWAKHEDEKRQQQQEP